MFQDRMDQSLHECKTQLDETVVCSYVQYELSNNVKTIIQYYYQSLHMSTVE